MFFASKLAKTKPLMPPAHKENLNSRNQSFNSAQTLLEKPELNRSGTNLRQTSLGIRKCSIEENNQPSTSKKSKTEFFLLPLPREKHKSSNTANQKSSMEIDSNDDVIDPMSKNGRGQVALTGQVDFALKIKKLYPNKNALWSIYGKLVRIIEGKNHFEHTLLLRNVAGCGPVLQCVFFDFDNILDSFETGSILRVVGSFSDENHLKTFKIEKASCENSSEHFTRIQNVISFVLQQN